MQCGCSWFERIFWGPKYIDNDVSQVIVASFGLSEHVASEKGTQNDTQNDTPCLSNLKQHEPAKVVIVYGSPVCTGGDIERV